MSIINLTEQESIFCQALATTSLLAELENTDFLNSDYYKKVILFNGNNDNFKKILDASGIGNPATLQMFLYILLVMPKETLSNLDGSTISSWGNELKTEIQYLAPVVTTTYPNESNNDLDSINYYRHIRNAVSHSKCVYETENGRCYVTFKDENPRDASQKCEIKMLTSDVGKMLEVLQKQIMEYLNAQWENR
ncbi:HEPN family nuclease [Streptococcus parasuis]|uniref:HEPN family nuclease n=1 Tax=Streptococcus parasuis TaxID=1501662 RepID=UPI00370D91A8